MITLDASSLGVRTGAATRGRIKNEVSGVHSGLTPMDGSRAATAPLDFASLATPWAVRLGRRILRSDNQIAAVSAQRRVRRRQ